MVDLASPKTKFLDSTCLGFCLYGLDLGLEAISAQDLWHPGKLLVEAGLLGRGDLEGLELLLQAKHGSVVMCDALLDALTKEVCQLQQGIVATFG